MLNRFSRSELIFGNDAMKRLAGAHIAIFGIGGVGGYAAEALARSGIGAIDLIDSDTVCITNINRQIYATDKTVGRYKVDVAAERIADINPTAVIRTFKTFYMPETADEFDFKNYDYIVDAIDTVTGKIELAVNADRVGTPIISSMGAGNKLDPTAFEVADIYKTSVCPLARVMRRELKSRGIKALKVVYSKEMPTATDSAATAEFLKHRENSNGADGNSSARRQIPGSNAFVPPVAGLIIAGEVVKDLIKQQ